MEHMTRNYMLGLVVLVISFLVLFYIPLGYIWVKAREQKRNQNKQCGTLLFSNKIKTKLGKT